MYCIDRFEDEFAVCESENRERIVIAKSELFNGAKEGDWFEISEDGYRFLADETNKRRQKNIDKLRRIMR